MSSMVELLHDRVDAQEALMERAAAIVAEAKGMLAGIVRELDSAADDAMERALEELAVYVGDRLAALTTEAVGSGASFASRVVKING